MRKADTVSYWKEQINQLRDELDLVDATMYELQAQLYYAQEMLTQAEKDLLS